MRTLEVCRIDGAEVFRNQQDAADFFDSIGQQQTLCARCTRGTAAPLPSAECRHDDVRAEGPRLRSASATANSSRGTHYRVLRVLLRQRANALAALKAERASVAAKGRQAETEAAPIR
jgi:hypothetical protein